MYSLIFKNKVMVMMT